MRKNLLVVFAVAMFFVVALPMAAIAKNTIREGERPTLVNMTIVGEPLSLVDETEDSLSWFLSIRGIGSSPWIKDRKVVLTISGDIAEVVIGDAPVARFSLGDMDGAMERVADYIVATLRARGELRLVGVR
ncbi:hypothetical protein KKG24_01230 [Patescibacteria group bacterium]|nr:hypothetical protein [Patescibacteria group bacterium]